MSATRSVVKWTVAAMFAVSLVCGVPESQAIEVPLLTMKIEEDWELVVIEPTTVSVGPQVSCVISPVNNIDSTYANLEVNYVTLPE